MSDPIFWPIAIGVLGAIAGSFLATIVVRWPEGRSVLHGRSACDGCGRTLAPRDLIPIVSGMLARGRCRTCDARVDPVHGRIEGLAALIGVAAGLAVPGPEALAGALFGWLLLTLAALDLAEMWLPDALTATLALAGVATALAGFAPPPVDRVVGGVAGFASLWAVGAGYRAVRGREGLGGGDPKLFGAIGLWLGWRMLPAVLLIAALVGLGVALAMRMRGRDVAGDTALPFGAFLAIAAYPAWLAMIVFAP